MRRNLLAHVLTSALVVLVVGLLVADPLDAQRGERRAPSRTARFELAAGVRTCLDEHAPGRFRAWSCRGPVGGTDAWFVVNPDDADASNGDGPFCDGASCHGPFAGNETGGACLYSAATVELSCHFEME